MTIDSADHRRGALDDRAKQRRQFARAGDRRVPGVTTGRLGEIRTGAECAAGMTQHNGPDRGVVGGPT